MATLSTGLQLKNEVMARLRPKSREWLLAALDPFHDAPLRVEGFPGMESRKSVTTTFTSTFTLVGANPPEQPGPGEAPLPPFPVVALGSDNQALPIWGNNVDIQFSPVVTADMDVATLPYNPNLPPGWPNPFPAYATNDAGQWGPSPITVAFTPEDGTDPVGYRIFPRVPEMPFRVIALGYEIADATPEMYKQGMIYCSSAPLSTLEHNVWMNDEHTIQAPTGERQQQVLTPAGDLTVLATSSPTLPQQYLLCYSETPPSGLRYVPVAALPSPPGDSWALSYEDPTTLTATGETPTAVRPLLATAASAGVTGNPLKAQGNTEAVAAVMQGEEIVFPTTVPVLRKTLPAAPTMGPTRAAVGTATTVTLPTGLQATTFSARSCARATWLASIRGPTESLMLSDTTQWELMHGAYIVPRLLGPPEWDSSASLDNLAPTGAVTDGLQSGKQMLVAKSPDGKTWAMCAGSTSQWAETTANIVGAAFAVPGEKGNWGPGQTRLVITVRMFVELLPTAKDVTLSSLARPAAPYDPDILAIYSDARSKLPLATQLHNNAIGGWLILVVKVVATAIAAIKGWVAKIKERRRQQQQPAAQATGRQTRVSAQRLS